MLISEKDDETSLSVSDERQQRDGDDRPSRMIQPEPHLSAYPKENFEKMNPVQCRCILRPTGSMVKEISYFLIIFFLILKHSYNLSTILPRRIYLVKLPLTVSEMVSTVDSLTV